MTFGTMERIQTVTVPAGGQAAIEFTNIPQTYSDLKLVLSTRDNANLKYANIQMQFNNSGGTAYSDRLLYATTSALSTFNTSQASTFFQYSTSANATADTFASTEIYITNYTSSANKTVSADTVTEDNATNTTIMGISAQLWANNAAITSIKLTPNTAGSTFVQHSTATLYGITRVPAGAKATGGAIYDDASFFYHVFTSSGTFTPSQNLSCDVLVVAGGGGGGRTIGGGGGAGGLLGHTSQSLTATNYTITIGAGGIGGTSTFVNGTNGNNSQFGSLTASIGGGGGSSFDRDSGANGGSGGGATGGGDHSGGTGTSGQGNNGGSSLSSGQVAGGGGGRGAVGANGISGSAGNGGIGSSAYSSWGLATQTGQNSGGTVYYAGGGGGGSNSGAPGSPTAGTGGLGGGASGLPQASAGVPAPATANTGGGGGGSGGNGNTSNGGNGGSGIVIVRYAK